MTVAASGLLERARAGDKRAIARLLSVVENDEPGAADALRTLYPLTGQAEIGRASCRERVSNCV